MEISIIVPVYNAANYLQKCVNSILEQTYQDFEMILINDGSKDESEQICREFQKQDDRVHVYSQENSGVSVTRNNGIKYANGRYIVFIDSDDYVEKNYLERLYNLAIKTDADIVCCDYIIIEDGVRVGLDIHNTLKNRLIKSKREYVLDYVQKREFYSHSVWAKIFKKEIIADVEFPRIKYGEDTVFMMEVFKKSPVTVLDTFPGYIYVRNVDSATVSANSDKLNRAIVAIDHVNIGRALIELARECEIDIFELAVNDYAGSIYSALSYIIKAGDRGLYQNQYDNLSSNIDLLRKNKGLRLKYRVMYRVYRKSPDLYWLFLSKILKIKEGEVL